MPQTVLTPYKPPPNQPFVPHFADDHFIVVEKPSGLLSVPGRGAEKQDCLVSRVNNVFSGALIVHRLDMETSGLMVLALNETSHKALSKQFERREVEKTYIARVAGHLGAEEGEIDLPLMKDWPNRPLQKIDAENGKPSQTYWRCLQLEPHASRLELTPLTGRTHQLRVHLNAIGHPILGDLLYGTDDSRAAADRLQLHASNLGFQHPHTGEHLSFSSNPQF